MFTSVHHNIDCAIYMVKQYAYREGRHFHLKQSFTTLSYILDGDVVTEAENRRYPAQTGDVMIHRSNTPFGVLSKRKGKRIFINLDLRVHGEIDFFYYYAVPRVVRLQDVDRFEHTMQQLLQVWQMKDNIQRELRSISLVFDLVSQLLESRQTWGMKSQMPKLPVDERLATLIQYIEDHLKEDLTVQVLSDFSNLHPTSLQRKLRQICGMTPAELVRHLRLKEARKQLENSETTLDQIAFECGFHDAAYFSKLFKKYFRMTPGTYRKQLAQTKGQR